MTTASKHCRAQFKMLGITCICKNVESGRMFTKQLKSVIIQQPVNVCQTTARNARINDLNVIVSIQMIMLLGQTRSEPSSFTLQFCRSLQGLLKAVKRAFDGQRPLKDMLKAF